MFEQDTLIYFLLAAFVLLITPGPAVIYIVARSVSQGALAGFVAALGMHVGTLVHIAAAAYGVSQLLMTSTLAFNIVKYLGAAYLIYLGIRSFLSKQESAAPGKPDKKRMLTILRESAIVNILNPKMALFFFAFLPQFVDTASEVSVSRQILILGLIFVVIGIVSDGLYAVFAGVLGERLKRAGSRYGKYITGTVFTGLGVATALARR
ncbi:LysE family translocator [Gammaproteobacteria bacterium]|nr:LysE family translocator [Gammaproteobacteria bacterium]